MNVTRRGILKVELAFPFIVIDAGTHRSLLGHLKVIYRLVCGVEKIIAPLLLCVCVCVLAGRICLLSTSVD